MKLSTKAIAAALIVAAGVVGTAVWHDAPTAPLREELAPMKRITTTTDARRAGSPGTDDGVVAAAVPGTANPTHAEPQRNRPRRERRDALLADIRAARENYRKSMESSPDGAAAEEPEIDKEYLRERMQEDLIPSAINCYNAVLVKDPEFSGQIVLDFDIVADENLGGVVDRVDFGEATDVSDQELRTCMQDAMYEMTFAPPKSGGTVSVHYPLVFETD